MRGSLLKDAMDCPVSGPVARTEPSKLLGPSPHRWKPDGSRSAACCDAVDRMASRGGDAGDGTDNVHMKL
eukprot:2646335-Rhodomonas_salina.2